MLIGLNGKKGSGKDTAGAYLVERYGFERLSFAAPLKESAAAALGLGPDGQAFEEWKNDPNARVIVATYKDEEGNDERIWVDISVREFLQFYGTEAHRDIFGLDFWTKQLLDKLDPDGRYVITDARFENECGAVREAGGIIMVIDRPEVEDGDGHASEASLPDELVDTVLWNHGTIEDLHKALDAYMIVAESGLAVEAVTDLANSA